jgi:hypothetical protein
MSEFLNGIESKDSGDESAKVTLAYTPLPPVPFAATPTNGCFTVTLTATNVNGMPVAGVGPSMATQLARPQPQ